MPEALVVTVTARLQEAPPARLPPVKERVRGAVAAKVPPHCVEEAVATVSPLGSVSVKAMPLKAIVALGLVSVNVNVEVAPIATGFGEKALLMMGEEGAPQPVNVTLSRFRSAPLLVVLAPVP